MYLGDYIHTRLAHMFLIDVSEPFIKFIDFFESRLVRAHLLFPKMALLLNQLFTMFLKPMGMDRMMPSRLLKLDYKDTELQLSREDVFLGDKARRFIKTIGMTTNSPELLEFFKGVSRFYHKTSEKLVKYFKTPLKSKFLAALTIIDPMNRQHMDIVGQREMWQRLGEQLNHLITEEELVTLLTVELADFQMLEAVEDEGVEVDLWWAQVAEVMLGGERQFPIISRFTIITTTNLILTLILNRFALALCTICNSSSEVERDFSDMEAIFADSRANSTGQELLEAKMTVRSAVKQEADNCARCEDAKEERKKKALAGERLPKEKCNHCHCSFLEVDDELLADLRNSGPHKRCDMSEKKLAVENKSQEKKMEEVKTKSKEDYNAKLKTETILMKKRFLKNQDKVVAKEKQSDKKSKKRIAIEKIDASDKKKKKLAFLEEFKDNDGNVRKKK